MKEVKTSSFDVKVVTWTSRVELLDTKVGEVETKKCRHSMEASEVEHEHQDV